MNSKQRFYAAVEYKDPDRPPIAPLAGQPYVFEKLFGYLNVKTYDEFQLKVGEDFRFVYPRYAGRELRKFEDGSYEGFWGERYKRVSFSGGTYEEPVYQPFKDIEDVKELKTFEFPSPDWYDYSTVKEQCEKYSEYVVMTGGAGHMDFMNGIGFIRGIEQVYLDVGLESEVFLELVERRYEYFYEIIRRTLEAGKGAIDVVYCGEDLGTQLGPVISPEKFDLLFAPKYKSLFELVHSYGAKTMMHSCGSVRAFIPRLIAIGLDILDVIQVDAAGMDIIGLHRDFYGKIVLCGSISVQSLLPKGSPEDIRREIELRKELFRHGGMIIGPTNVMQIDMPMENFEAMCRAIGCMK